MRRTKTRFSPGVDVAEPRVLLSAAAPMLTPHALNGVVRDVREIMGTLGRTGDTARASARLTALSSRIPSGPQALAPMWREDVALYRPHAAVSVGATERRVLGDLYRFVRGGPGGGHPRVPAPGPTPTPPPPPPPGPGAGGTGRTPAPSASLDSVAIQNTTGLALQVTVHLEVPQVQKPWITRTIPAQGSTTLPFNFGSATGAFMTIDVIRADGGQSPRPFEDFSLEQPMGGYNGAPFTISVFGSTFNISPG